MHYQYQQFWSEYQEICELDTIKLVHYITNGSKTEKQRKDSQKKNENEMTRKNR